MRLAFMQPSKTYFHHRFYFDRITQFVADEHGNERKRKMEEKWVEGAYYKPGGYSWIFLVRQVLQILILLQTKKCHYLHPFSDLTSKKYCHHYL